MNIRHKPGGEPEIKLDAAEMRWLTRAADVCSMIGHHLEPGEALRPKMFEAAQAMHRAIADYGKTVSEPLAAE